MATDARNHTVPAATDHPSRATLLTLALGIRDVVPVANTTARAAVVSAMTAAGVSVSTSNPLYVHRADARPDSAIEVTTDGTTWQAITLTSGLTAFTPALTASTTNPTLGSGNTDQGQYETDGQWCRGTADIIWGTTGLNVGVGSYFISLPVACAAAAAVVAQSLGFGNFADASTGNNYSLTLVAAGSTTTARLAVGNGSGLLGTSTPVVPAAGDRINVSYSYPTA